MRFAPPGSAILKDLPRSPHSTPFAQPTRLASSQVRSPKQALSGIIWCGPRGRCVALRRVRRRAPEAFPHAANTAYTKSEVRAGGNVGVGCVKTLALTWQTISESLCVERNTSHPPDNAKSFRIALQPYRGEGPLAGIPQDAAHRSSVSSFGSRAAAPPP